MTDTTGSGSNQAFVRTENIPQAPPPLSTRGAIGWTRENLFSSPLNVVLTIGALYVLYLFLPPLIQWAFIDAIWTGTSNADCKGGEGALRSLVAAQATPQRPTHPTRRIVGGLCWWWWCG